MMKALAEMPEGEEQRRKAVHSMACMAPLKDPSLSGKENRRAAAEFYEYRDRMRDTYPLDWLFSDTGY